MLPVVWHYNDGFWDCAFPRYILNRAAQIQHSIGLESAMPARVGAIVIPGRHSCGDYEQINKAAKHFGKVVFVIIGDEEGIFHSDELKHPKKIVWWFMPPFNPKQQVDRVAPNGWPTDAPFQINWAKKLHFKVREFDWSFMGQMTHSRRIECVNATQEIMERGKLLVTDGFTRGVPRGEYYDVMVRSKLVLCPSGPCTPDSFRFAEALEAGCVPIVDDLTQNPNYPPGYWNYTLGDLHLPFPLIHDWSTLPAVADFWLKTWKSRAEECRTWWNLKKILWCRQMQEDLRD